MKPLIMMSTIIPNVTASSVNKVRRLFLIRSRKAITQNLFIAIFSS
jgi:hypothetical protein